MKDNKMKIKLFLIILLLGILFVNKYSFAESEETKYHSIHLSNNFQLCNSAPMKFSFAIEEASKKALDSCEIIYFTPDELKIIRNSIFAKYGRKFTDPHLRTFFNQQPWYKINPNFSEKMLSDTQRKNVLLLKNIEELKTIKQGSKEQTNADEINHPNFPKLNDFMVSIGRGGKIPDNVKEIIEKSIKKKMSEPINNTEVRGKPIMSLLPIGKRILVEYPYYYKGREGGECNSNIYSSKGDFIKSIPFCPLYVLKDNPNLFINPANTGCCGAFAWDFNFYNDDTKKTLSFDCPDGDCQDVLLTWLPDGKELLLALLRGSYQSGRYSYSTLEIYIINSVGNLLSLGRIKMIYKWHETRYPSEGEECPYGISNLLGVKELSPGSLWMLRFSGDTKDRYALLSASKENEIEPAGLIINSDPSESVIKINGEQSGLTPLTLFLKPGKYKISTLHDGYYPEDKDITLSSTQTSALSFVLEPLTTKRIEWQRRLLTKCQRYPQSLVYKKVNIYYTYYGDLDKASQNTLNYPFDYSTNKSGIWITDTIPRVYTGGDDSSMVIDSTGKAHIIYYDTSVGVYYASNASGKWEIEKIDSFVPKGYFEREEPCITLDNKSQVHVSYINASLGNRMIKYATISAHKWVTYNVSPMQKGLLSGIAVSKNNKIYISFCDGELHIATTNLPRGLYTKAKDFVLRSLNLKTDLPVRWFTQTIDSCISSGGIIMDKKNHVHTIYIDRNNFLKYATNKSGTWKIETIQKIIQEEPSLPVPQMIFLDDADKPHISYFINDSLKYANTINGKFNIYDLGTHLYPLEIVLGNDKKIHIIAIESGSCNIFELSTPGQ